MAAQPRGSSMARVSASAGVLPPDCIGHARRQLALIHAWWTQRDLRAVTRRRGSMHGQTVLGSRPPGTLGGAAGQPLPSGKSRYRPARFITCTHTHTFMACCTPPALSSFSHGCQFMSAACSDLTGHRPERACYRGWHTHAHTHIACQYMSLQGSTHAHSPPSSRASSCRRS